jgi:hypothetical protein
MRSRIYRDDQSLEALPGYHWGRSVLTGFYPAEGPSTLREPDLPGPPAFYCSTRPSPVAEDMSVRLVPLPQLRALSSQPSSTNTSACVCGPQSVTSISSRIQVPASATGTLMGRRGSAALRAAHHNASATVWAQPHRGPGYPPTRPLPVVMQSHVPLHVRPRRVTQHPRVWDVGRE